MKFTEVRSRYPDTISDQVLAEAIRKKHFSGVPPEDAYRQMEYTPQQQAPTPQQQAPTTGRVTLSDYRERFPEYADLDDQTLAGGIHRKYYPGETLEDAHRLMGYTSPPTVADRVARIASRGTARAQQQAAAAASGAWDSVTQSWDNLRGRPKGFDYTSGVQDARIRGLLSLADNPTESKTRAGEIFGEANVVRTPAGDLAVKPAGLLAAGLEAPDLGLPVVVDETGVTRYDLADAAGSLPSFLSSVGAGVAASGMGMFPGLALTALATMAGKGAGELVEHFAGENRQSGTEVLKDVAMEGALAGAGELGFRGVMAPAGRAATRPGSPASHFFTGKEYLDPERMAVVGKAKAMGATPLVGQITGHPILGRVQQLAESFSGNKLDKVNAAAMQRKMRQMAGEAGPAADLLDTGAMVKQAIEDGRTELSTWGGVRARGLDERTGGRAVIPTAGLRQRVAQLLQGKARTREGKPIGVTDDVRVQLRDYLNVQDNLTWEQWQSLRTDLREGMETGTLMPGMSNHSRSQMLSAVDGLLDDAERVGSVSPGLARDARQFRADYKKRADLFGDDLVKRVAKKVAPEHVLKEAFKPGSVTSTNRIMSLLDPVQQAQVRRGIMDDLLEGASAPNPKDVTQRVFRGQQFQKDLSRKWKGGSLDAALGPRHAEALREFADVQSLLAEKQPMIGGLAVANVALHPWQNIDKVIQWGMLPHVLAQPKALRYLTEGFKAENAREAGKWLGRLAAQYPGTVSDNLSYH